MLRVLSGPLPNFHDLAANDATTDLIINVITAVGQFQRDLQNELTTEGIAAADRSHRLAVGDGYRIDFRAYLLTWHD